MYIITDPCMAGLNIYILGGVERERERRREREEGEREEGERERERRTPRISQD